MTARKNANKATGSPVEAPAGAEGVQTLTEQSKGPSDPQEAPQTPLEESIDQAVLEGEFEEVDQTANQETVQEPDKDPSEPVEELEEIHREMAQPTELVAYCPHCGNGVKSMDWGSVAKWFGEHCQQAHPEVFANLFKIASAFLGLMIADTYDTKPEWGDQPSMEVLRGELMDIIEGGRDPLEDGLS